MGKAQKCWPLPLTTCLPNRLPGALLGGGGRGAEDALALPSLRIRQGAQGSQRTKLRQRAHCVVGAQPTLPTAQARSGVCSVGYGGAGCRARRYALLSAPGTQAVQDVQEVQGPPLSATGLDAVCSADGTQAAAAHGKRWQATSSSSSGSSRGPQGADTNLLRLGVRLRLLLPWR